MNVLDIVATALGKQVFKGYMPATPDTALAIFEYSAPPPEHFFGGMNVIESVQLRSRAPDPLTAYEAAKEAAQTLNRYHNGTVSVLQATAIMDIGKDDHNPPRHEYTVNFEIRRL